MVAATLTAWSHCPGIVKKQLDKQSAEIMQLRAELRVAQLKLNTRKSDFDRVAKVETHLELTRHKDKIEGTFRKKLEDERLKMNNIRLEEIDGIMSENNALKKEITDLMNANSKKFK